jgi:cephalosporin hydroxylase
LDYSAHGEQIPNDEEFKKLMADYKRNMGLDFKLRNLSLKLQEHADMYRYTYQQEWCGVPIVRLPDDILVLQEIVWSIKPSFIIETGIARGGSLILSASLMALAKLKPRVLGLDIKILNHTKTAILNSPFSEFIKIKECSSVSEEAIQEVEDFISLKSSNDFGVLILDSNHTHDHVYAELNSLASLLPVGSIILVADTLIEEMPSDYYAGRPWGKGNNPLTAVNQFLNENSNFTRSDNWSKRGLLSEFRDGILLKRS